jgi:hypothetical protein
LLRPHAGQTLKVTARLSQEAGFAIAGTLRQVQKDPAALRLGKRHGAQGCRRLAEGARQGRLDRE